MTVTLSNGERLNFLGVHGGPITYQGVIRDCLTFLFDPEEMSVEQLLEKFTAENCKAVRLLDETDENAREAVHENYTIRTGAGVGMRDLARRGGYGSSVTDEQQTAYVSMAQSALAERMLLSQQEAVDALIVSALEQ